MSDLQGVEGGRNSSVTLRLDHTLQNLESQVDCSERPLRATGARVKLLRRTLLMGRPYRPTRGQSFVVCSIFRSFGSLDTVVIVFDISSLDCWSWLGLGTKVARNYDGWVGRRPFKFQWSRCCNSFQVSLPYFDPLWSNWVHWYDDETRRLDSVYFGLKPPVPDFCRSWFSTRWIP